MKQINLISRNTMTIGVLLILVGLLGRFLSGTTSITALIPLFFGVPIVALGWLSQSSKRAKIAQIVTLVLAVLGILGTYTAVLDVFEGSRFSAALLSRGSMLLLCLVLLILSGNWLIQSLRS